MPSRYHEPNGPGWQVEPTVNWPGLDRVGLIAQPERNRGWVELTPDDARELAQWLIDAADATDAVHLTGRPPMQPDPRTWQIPTIPADVTRLRSHRGITYTRTRPGAPYWHDEDSSNPWSWHEPELLARSGPLTEVTDDHS